MVNIFFLVILQHSNCLKFFNRKYYTSFQPPAKFMESNSLFGFSVVSSSDFAGLYVGAPLAKTDNGAQTGAVFKCELGKPECEKCFAIQDEMEYNVQNTKIRKPLFGITLTQVGTEEILACAPNINFITTSKYHCYLYSEHFHSNSLLGYAEAEQGKHYTQFTNYGITLVNLEKETPSSMLIGYQKYGSRKYRYTHISRISLLKAISGNEKNYVPVIEDQTLSYTILYNPINNADIYVIVTYYLTNHLKGSFEVKRKSDFKTHQMIDITDGSPGQYFGFSGTFGAFNKDSCPDVAISAPFYSKFLDEGRVYVYFCNQFEKIYYLDSMILNGDDEVSARFGVSVVVIGDRLRDGIESIAVLAAYWHTKNYAIYIYSSNGETLNSKYTDKIVSDQPFDETALLPFALFSKFSFSSSQFSDLLVQFPNNSTMKVHSAIEFKQIHIERKITVLHEIPDPVRECFTIDESEKCYFTSKYVLESCVYVSPLVNSKRIFNDVLKLKHSLHSSPGAFISSQTLKMEEDFSSPIYYKACFESKISFLYTSTSVVPIVVQINAFVEHKRYPECGDFCSDTIPVKIDQKIFNPFYECSSIECIPNIKISQIIQTGTYKNGHESTTIIKLKIVNDGPVTSYSLQLIIKSSDDWVIIDFIKIGGKRDETISKEVQNFEDRDATVFSVDYITHVSESFELDITLEIRAPLSKDSANIDVSIFDPMYRFKPDNERRITIPSDGERPLQIVCSHLPATLHLELSKTEEKNQRTSNLDYFFEINNNVMLESIKDVVLIVNITTTFFKKKLLNLAGLGFPGDFIQERCDPDVQNTCSQFKFSLNSKHLPPKSTRKIYIRYETDKNYFQLAQHKINKIDVFSTICYNDGEKEVCYTLNTQTPIKFVSNVAELKFSWPMLVSGILSTSVVFAIGVTAMKMLARFRDNLIPEIHD